MTFKEAVLYGLDEVICGPYQLSARQVSKTKSDLADELSQSRIIGAGAKISETFLSSLATACLANPHLASMYLQVVVAQTAAEMISDRARNTTGSIVREVSRVALEETACYRQVMSETLTKNGFSPDEAGAISGLPRKLYLTELQPIRLKMLLNLLTPISQGLILWPVSRIASAASFLSVLAVPVFGEWVFDQSDHKRYRQFRHAESAGSSVLLKKISREHIKMTDLINFVTGTPNLLFAIYHGLSNGMMNGLTVFDGLRKGLGHMNDLLSFQRARAEHLDTVKMFVQVLNTLSSDPFLVSPARDAEHCKESETVEVPNGFRDGVIIADFKAKLPNRKDTKLPPLNIKLKPGERHVVVCRSGSGKTETALALLRVMDHIGNIVFIKDGQQIKSHELSKEELRKMIYFTSERLVNPADTVADLFKGVFKKIEQKRYEEMTLRYGKDIVDQVFDVGTDLLDNELDIISRGKSVVYPYSMKDDIESFLNAKHQFVNKLLKQSGGNISQSGVDSKRSFESLSSGEKQRIVVSLAKEISEHFKPSLIILDEPLSRMGADDILFQLLMLNEISAPVLIFTPDEEDAETLKGLCDSQVSNLN